MCRELLRPYVVLTAVVGGCRDRLRFLGLGIRQPVVPFLVLESISVASRVPMLVIALLVLGVPHPLIASRTLAPLLTARRLALVEVEPQRLVLLMVGPLCQAPVPVWGLCGDGWRTSWRGAVGAHVHQLLLLGFGHIHA